MNSQYHNDEKISSSRGNSLINDIVNIDKFKVLDDRYIVTDICRNMNFRCEIDDNTCNVYHNSFGFSISFNNKKFKSVVGFIDIHLFSSDDKEKILMFLGNLIKKKELNLSVKNLKDILNGILYRNIKEISEIQNNIRIYVGKIMSNERELIFITMGLNA